MSKTLRIVCAVVGSLAMCHVTNASFTISGGSAPAGATIMEFETPLPLGGAGGVSGPATVSFGYDGQAVIGSVNNVYAQPFGATGQYLTSGKVVPNDSRANANATLSFGTDHTYIGLLWGSIDTYNTLTFYNNGSPIGNGTTEAQVTGPNVVAALGLVDFPYGNQSDAGTRYVNIVSTLPFDKVVATSSEYAFELDRVAVVPEPTTILAGAMLLLPFGASAIRTLRKKN